MGEIELGRARRPPGRASGDEAATAVGDAVRHVHARDAKAMQDFGVDFNPAADRLRELDSRLEKLIGEDKLKKMLDPDKAVNPPGRREIGLPDLLARPSGDDRELAILATAERLLAEQPLSKKPELTGPAQELLARLRGG